MLTGDTLFVTTWRDRPRGRGARGPRGIYRSLREKLLTLPDHVEVWPGHLGGSMCGEPEWT